MKLSKDIFEHIGKFVNIDSKKYSTSTLIYGIMNDINQVQKAVDALIRIVMHAFVLFIGGLLVLFSIDSYLLDSILPFFIVILILIATITIISVKHKNNLVKTEKICILLNPLTILKLFIGFETVVISWLSVFHVFVGRMPQSWPFIVTVYITLIIVALIVISNLVITFINAKASVNRVVTIFNSEISIIDF